MFLRRLEDTDSGVVVRLGPGQVRFGGVLPGKCDGARGVWYGPIEWMR